MARLELAHESSGKPTDAGRLAADLVGEAAAASQPRSPESFTADGTAKPFETQPGRDAAQLLNLLA